MKTLSSLALAAILFLSFSAVTWAGDYYGTTTYTNDNPPQSIPKVCQRDGVDVECETVGNKSYSNDRKAQRIADKEAKKLNEEDPQE